MDTRQRIAELTDEIQRADEKDMRRLMYRLLYAIESLATEIEVIDRDLAQVETQVEP